MADESSPGVSVILVHPIRFLPRTRLLHMALPETEWTLCGRSRVGSRADESELDSVVGGIPLTLCSRCEARKKLIEEGRPVGRSAPA